MTALDATVQPLPPERSIYMQRAAAQALEALDHFASGPVEYDSTALQLLDEWVDRLKRRGPLSSTVRVLVTAFLGQTFLHRYGGYWAMQVRGQRQSLGVVCPVVGAGDAMRFIDVADQVRRRFTHGISESLAFFFLVASVDLRGRSATDTV